MAVGASPVWQHLPFGSISHVEVGAGAGATGDGERMKSKKPRCRPGMPRLACMPSLYVGPVAGAVLGVWDWCLICV